MMGETHTFDSFECAMHALAPTCPHCGVRIAGHGVEQDGQIFCCAHCAEQQGASGLRDRARGDLARGGRSFTAPCPIGTARGVLYRPLPTHDRRTVCVALPSPLQPWP